MKMLLVHLSLVFAFAFLNCHAYFDHHVTYDGDHEVAEGFPFRISCRMSVQDPSEWTLDGKVIPGDHVLEYSLSEREVDSMHKELVLEVKLAQLHHEGEYRCNTKSRDFQHVHVVPEDNGEDDDDDDDDDDEEYIRVQDSNEEILKVNQTVSFYCTSARDDDTPVTWYKNSRRILDSPDSNIEMTGHHLIIEDAQDKDAAEYMCAVDTPYVTGYTDIGRIFHLKGPAKIVDFPQKLSIIKGRPLTLQCKTLGFPFPKVTWYIGNLLATDLQMTDVRISVYGKQQNAYLTVRDMSEDDIGLYTCRAENSLDSGKTIEYDEESASVYVRENMIETNEDEPGMGKLLVPGQPLTLQCNTTECPHCSVVWYKNGSELHSIPNRLQIHENNNSILIEHSTYDDAGVYVCAIDRKQLDVALNASIVVQSEIKLEKFNSSSSVIVQGSPLELYCNAKGAPIPSIKWFRGDEEIAEDDERIKLVDHNELKNAKLLIEEADFEDRNHYTCEAYNQVNSANITIFIRIKGKLAALWPFLGICAEVAILCTIIFVYERRKSMTQCEEPDTDLPTENKHHRDQKSKGQDIRQRK